MNISRLEQRVLHCLAQGGRIQHIWTDNRIVEIDCWSRDGYRLADCSLDLFKKLKKRGLIASTGGGPYRISRLGLDCVRAQADNR
ncbi:MAG TPA: YjhX family toxin [Rhizomicrobium sp.]